MWEIVLSLQLLQNREGAVAFRSWRNYTRGRLGQWVNVLKTLAPHASYFPDFLTPGDSGVAVEQGVDRVLSTPRGRLSEELGLLNADRTLPMWCRRLAEGDLETTRYLENAFLSYHRAVVQPYWPSVQKHVEADRARRLRALSLTGVEGLLASFRPLMLWRPPVLEVDYPVTQDLVLAGRGLLLMPSFYCWRAPVTLVNPELRPVLVYPVAHDLRHDIGGVTDRADRPLVALLGKNRAAILEAVQDGCTTTELSRRVGTSVASASQHATVLREAGLITTQRYGGSVLHSLSPLGFGLLTES